METTERAELISKLSENAPATQSIPWQLTPNYPGTPVGSMYVTLPFTGNLWIYYSYQSQPATVIQVWHQGGNVTPINPGENNISVNANDFIYYVANGISIKLAFQYV